MFMIYLHYDDDYRQTRSGGGEDRGFKNHFFVFQFSFQPIYKRILFICQKLVRFPDLKRTFLFRYTQPNILTELTISKHTHLFLCYSKRSRKLVKTSTL